LNAPPAGWVEGVREIRFTFGEFRIWTARIRAWVFEGHFLQAGGALAAMPSFSEVPPDIEVLAIQSLPVEGDLPKVTQLPDAIRYVPAHFSHHCIEIDGTFEGYLAGLSGKSRHEMARKVRRFAAYSAGRHELREYRAPGEMAEFVRVASALSKTTYQGRLLDVGLPDTPEFAEELEAAAAKDDVRSYLLFVDGGPVAYGYCRARGDVLSFEHTGYDAEAAPHSPGIFLLNEMLKRVHAERRFRIFDFGSGDAQYKRSYATTSRRCATVYHFRRSLGNRLLVASHRAVTGLSDACVRVLKTIGVKDRVRRFLRSRGRKAPAAQGEDQDRTPQFGT
jgi:CelD/BcsL family acetyltransferase involved in cellulose biosynthesis